MVPNIPSSSGQVREATAVTEVPAEDSERMRNVDWKRQGKMKISHILGCVSISKSPSVRQGDDLWAHHDVAVTFWGIYISNSTRLH